MHYFTNMCCEILSNIVTPQLFFLNIMFSQHIYFMPFLETAVQLHVIFDNFKNTASFSPTFQYSLFSDGALDIVQHRI